MGLPLWSGFQDSVLSMQQGWVQSLVRERRSRVLHGVAPHKRTFLSSANPLILILFYSHLHSANMPISHRWDILYTIHNTHHRVCMCFDHFPIWEGLKQCLDTQVNMHSCVLGLSGHFLLRRRPPGCCPALDSSSRSQSSVQSQRCCELTGVGVASH